MLLTTTTNLPSSDLSFLSGGSEGVPDLSLASPLLGAPKQYSLFDENIALPSIEQEDAANIDEFADLFDQLQDDSFELNDEGEDAFLEDDKEEDDDEEAETEGDARMDLAPSPTAAAESPLRFHPSPSLSLSSAPESPLRARFASIGCTQEEPCVSPVSHQDRISSLKIVPCSPSRFYQNPIDPRSCIQKPVFRGVDSRIPHCAIPRMDLRFGTATSVDAAVSKPVKKPSSPAKKHYVHRMETCWVCKSSKISEDRKRILHRYIEKKHRRNWKKGPRYHGRSSVAIARVREGGRFITSGEWI